MKSFYFLLSIFIFSVAGSIHASTLSGDLLEIQSKIWSWYSINYYETSRIDADIATKIQGNINLPKEQWDGPLAENSIQLWSKNYNWQPDFGPKWSKKLLLNFISALKNKDISKALSIRNKNDWVDPFIPPYNVPYNYLAWKVLKNWIFYLNSIAWGSIENSPTLSKDAYYFNYFFYRNGVLYRITSKFQFNYLASYTWNNLTSEAIELCELGICETLITKHVSIENTYWYQDLARRSFIDWLKNPSKNSVFENKYNQFVSGMSKIWK